MKYQKRERRKKQLLTRRRINPTSIVFTKKQRNSRLL
jgi:hypothetical protein